MALTGTLLADFSAFTNEAAKATTAVKTMGTGADDAAKQMAKLPEAAGAGTSAFSGLSEQIAATFTGMVSADAVVGAVSASFHVLTEFVNESVAAYSKQEDATVKLTAALRQHGLATPEVISQYNALATTFQNTTKYADEDIQAMESLLTLVGNVMPSQMQAALQASTNLRPRHRPRNRDQAGREGRGGAHDGARAVRHHGRRGRRQFPRLGRGAGCHQREVRRAGRGGD
jgi:hypothetical protein